RQRTHGEHAARDTRSSDDEHVGVRFSNRMLEPIVLEIRLVHDHAADRLETIDSCLLERVGNEDFHGLWTFRGWAFDSSFGSEDASSRNMGPKPIAQSLKPEWKLRCCESTTRLAISARTRCSWAA